MSPELAEIVRQQIDEARRFREELERYWLECERLADHQLEAIGVEKANDEKGGSKRRSRRVLRPRSKA